MRSLRSRLILASVLWTAGLLGLMHMASLHLMRAFPRIRGAHSGAVSVLGVACMAAGLLAARRSLAPFQRLRLGLGEVRGGREPRVSGEYPTEVQPLVDELNALLEEREAAVRRAFATAGDLAHGLKTPLALLAQEVGASAHVAQQVERMTRHVDYHLARARAAASGPSGAAPCPVEPCVDALIRVMRKLHGAREVELTAEVAAGVAVRVRREDLDEILGNLLDNACKWARTRATLTAAPGRITVDDDGPGLAPELRARALERGVRLDEAAPGSGLGLAIVRDLCELYGGSVALEDSPLGGLRVRVGLPESR